MTHNSLPMLVQTQHFKILLHQMLENKIHKNQHVVSPIFILAMSKCNDLIEGQMNKRNFCQCLK